MEELLLKQPATSDLYHPDSIRALPSFFDSTRNELSTFLSPDFRATQLYEAVYKHWIDDLHRVTTLPKSLRAEFSATLDIALPAINQTFEARDGTRRHLIRLQDHELIETVFIPDGGRNTFCVSSQAGCALACAFCLTGQLGFGRHLSAGEIVSQVVVAQRTNIPARGMRDHFNVVFMGMGEPLHNYDAVVKALEILNDPAGLNMSMSRITVSTVGLIPELERLSREPRIPNLAVSLTGTTDEIRNRLMPINKTYPIRDLVSTLRRFPAKPGQITLEYVLLEGITDSGEEAHRLARIARRIPASVNLIPLNESPDLHFKRPHRAAILNFQDILRERGVRAFIRKSRGDDISAACGQLKKKWAEIPPSDCDLQALGIPKKIHARR